MQKIFLSAILAIYLSAATEPKKVGAAFEYDAANGWWWYKEKYVSPDNKEFETKEKMAPKDKREKEESDEKLKILKEQNEKLSAIKERLEYAYPNITPIYTKNAKTGKECKTNSNVDCFVFPLQAEAQHVPVMADWLSNPSPENSKEWLKWQAKYFNHLTDIGYGNKFAYLNGGDDVYNTDNYNSNGEPITDNKTASMQKNREYQILNEHKNKLAYMIFLGVTDSLDTSNQVKNTMSEWNLKGYKDWSFYFVFETQADIDKLEKELLYSANNSDKDAWKQLRKKGFVVVRPDLFKRFNVQISPTIVTTYKKQDKDVIWQKVSTGHISPALITSAAVQFLIYNKIVEPKELSNKNLLKGYDDRSLKTDTLKEDKIFKETPILEVTK